MSSLDSYIAFRENRMQKLAEAAPAPGLGERIGHSVGKRYYPMKDGLIRAKDQLRGAYQRHTPLAARRMVEIGGDVARGTLNAPFVAAGGAVRAVAGAPIRAAANTASRASSSLGRTILKHPGKAMLAGGVLAAGQAGVPGASFITSMATDIVKAPFKEIDTVLRPGGVNAAELRGAAPDKLLRLRERLPSTANPFDTPRRANTLVPSYNPPAPLEPPPV